MDAAQQPDSLHAVRLTTLPDDVLLHILSSPALALRDVLAAACTCTRLSTVALRSGNDAQLFGSVCLGPGEGYSWQADATAAAAAAMASRLGAIRAWFAAHGGGVRRLVLDPGVLPTYPAYGGNQHFQAVPREVLQALPLNASLEALELRGPCDASQLLLPLLRGRTSMHMLELHYDNVLRSAEAMAEFEALLPSLLQLRALELCVGFSTLNRQQCKCVALISRLTRLTRLHLVENMTPIGFLAALTNLQRLSLDTMVPDNGAPIPTSVTHLDWRECNKYLDHVPASITRLTALRHLHLEGFRFDGSAAGDPLAALDARRCTSLILGGEMNNVRRFPECALRMPALRVLALLSAAENRRGCFVIPSDIGSALPCLELLDLAGSIELLNASLPASISALTRLSRIVINTEAAFEVRLPTVAARDDAGSGGDDFGGERVELAVALGEPRGGLPIGKWYDTTASTEPFCQYARSRALPVTTEDLLDAHPSFGEVITFLSTRITHEHVPLPGDD